MMDYIQFFTLLGTMIAGFRFLYNEFKSSEMDIREDITNQSNRQDEFYEMFINHIKQQKQTTDP